MQQPQLQGKATLSGAYIHTQSYAAQASQWRGGQDARWAVKLDANPFP